MKAVFRLLQHPAVALVPLLAPMLLFAYLIARYAVNVPYQDAFDGLVGPVAALSKNPGLAEGWRILYEQDDERRVIFNRLLAYGVYLVNGEHDHRLQIYVGCLTLLGFWLLFYRTIRRLGLPLWTVIPVSLFLFQPQYYEGVFWSMLPGQYFAVFFFAFWTIYLVARPERWALGAALVTAVLAICSDSNGSFAWVTGILILLYQRRYRHLLVWVLAIIPVLFLYYYQLKIPAYRPKISDNLLQLPEIVITDFFAFQGIFADPGPGFGLTVRVALPAAVGVLVFVAIGYWLLSLLTQYPVWNWPTWLTTARERYRQHPHPVLFLTGGAVVLLITMLAFSVARAGDGIEDLFFNRYKLIAALVLLLLYGLVLVGTPEAGRRTVAVAFLGFSLVFWGTAYFQYWSEAVNFRRALLIDAYSWQHTRTLPSSPIYLSFRKPVDDFVLEALRTRTYRFPEGFYSGIGELARQDTTARLRLATELSDKVEYLTVRDSAFVRGPGRDDGAYIVLHSDRMTYLFYTVQQRNGVRPFLRTGNYYRPGYVSTPILLHSLRPDTYRIGVLTVAGEDRSVQYSAQRLVVPDNGLAVLRE